MSVVFYKDSSKKFECSVKIEGTEYAKLKTRLILEFKDKILMFPGTVKEGRVSIKVPSLSDIEDDSANATLEVIADSTYFEAWKSQVDVKNKKTIQVSEVSVGSDSPTIIVENIVGESVKKQKRKIRKKVLTKKSIFKESCSNKNKKLVSKFVKEFQKLNESKTRTTKTELKNFKPKPIIQKWANSVFVNSKTSTAKFCMLKLQNSI